jgi:hypothetical protein
LAGQQVSRPAPVTSIWSPVLPLLSDSSNPKLASDGAAIEIMVAIVTAKIARRRIGVEPTPLPVGVGAYLRVVC